MTIEASPPPAGPDRHRDLRGWLLAPLVTLLLAPLSTLSIGIIVGEGATDYPALCDAVEADNGCEETVLSMFAAHAAIFLVGWLLLWALPWWRGLNRLRAWCAVLVGAVLIVAPLRLVSAKSLIALFDIDHWRYDIFSGDSRPADGMAGIVLVVIAVLMFGVPFTGYLLLRGSDRRFLRSLCALLAILLALPSLFALREGIAVGTGDAGSDPGQTCVVHSGSVNRCPGG